MDRLIQMNKSFTIIELQNYMGKIDRDVPSLAHKYPSLTAQHPCREFVSPIIHKVSAPLPGIVTVRKINIVPHWG
jgi:hypothetical protein